MVGIQSWYYFCNIFFTRGCQVSRRTCSIFRAIFHNGRVDRSILYLVPQCQKQCHASTGFHRYAKSDGQCYPLIFVNEVSNATTKSLHSHHYFLVRYQYSIFSYLPYLHPQLFQPGASSTHSFPNSPHLHPPRPHLATPSAPLLLHQLVSAARVRREEFGCNARYRNRKYRNPHHQMLP